MKAFTATTLLLVLLPVAAAAADGTGATDTGASVTSAPVADDAGPESKPSTEEKKSTLGDTSFHPRVRARWHMYRAYPTFVGGTDRRIARMHHAFGADVFLWFLKYARVAVSLEGGFHRRLGNSDFILGGGFLGGVQYPGQFSPYFDLSFMFGAYGSTLFDVQTITFAFRTMAEVGVEFYPTRGLFLFAALGHSWLFLSPGFVRSIAIRFGFGL